MIVKHTLLGLQGVKISSTFLQKILNIFYKRFYTFKNQQLINEFKSRFCYCLWNSSRTSTGAELGPPLMSFVPVITNPRFYH